MWNLTICSYNIMIPVPEPLRLNGQLVRARLIPKAILEMEKKYEHGIDVICFQELIPDEHLNIVCDQMAKYGWKYRTKPIKESYATGNFKLVSGGVIICSKYPILTQFCSVFDTDCESADCAASKGISYARILKGRNVVNIFGTHFQAWDTPKGRLIRTQQAQHCKKFISSLNIPFDEPVVMLGDFNIDLYTKRLQIQQLLDIVELDLCKIVEKSHLFTSDPKTNSLMGNDETIMYATDLYPKGCYEDYINSLRCPCCPQEWLDYITYSNKHLKPKHAEMKVEVLKSALPFTTKMNITTEREISDLSDHYPLVGCLSWSKECDFKHRNIECNIMTSEHGWISVIVVLSGILIVILFILIIIYCLNKSYG
jgi:endonuclease/exonuclease/phosphatase family metal-dependent hydrolase